MINLSLFILCVLAIVAIFGLTKAKSLGKTKQQEIWPFYAKKPLSLPEQVLYFRLIEALPDHIVLAQVQLSRFLGVKKGHNNQSWLNRINRMSADFVICRKDASIIAVIELDDSTHQKPDRQIADNKKDGALKAAGIKTVRWQARLIPDVSLIKAELLD